MPAAQAVGPGSGEGPGKILPGRSPRRYSRCTRASRSRGRRAQASATRSAARRLQTRAVPSRLAVARARPSGRKATVVISRSLSCVTRASLRRVAISHT